MHTVPVDWQTRSWVAYQFSKRSSSVVVSCSPSNGVTVVRERSLTWSFSCATSRSRAHTDLVFQLSAACKNLVCSSCLIAPPVSVEAVPLAQLIDCRRVWRQSEKDGQASSAAFACSTSTAAVCRKTGEVEPA